MGKRDGELVLVLALLALLAWLLFRQRSPADAFGVQPETIELPYSRMLTQPLVPSTAASSSTLLMTGTDDEDRHSWPPPNDSPPPVVRPGAPDPLPPILTTTLPEPRVTGPQGPTSPEPGPTPPPGPIVPPGRPGPDSEGSGTPFVTPTPTPPIVQDKPPRAPHPIEGSRKLLELDRGPAASAPAVSAAGGISVVPHPLEGSRKLDALDRGLETQPGSRATTKAAPPLAPPVSFFKGQLTTISPKTGVGVYGTADVRGRDLDAEAAQLHREGKISLVVGGAVVLAPVAASIAGPAIGAAAGFASGIVQRAPSITAPVAGEAPAATIARLAAQRTGAVASTFNQAAPAVLTIGGAGAATYLLVDRVHDSAVHGNPYNRPNAPPLAPPANPLKSQAAAAPAVQAPTIQPVAAPPSSAKDTSSSPIERKATRIMETA